MLVLHELQCADSSCGRSPWFGPPVTVADPGFTYHRDRRELPCSTCTWPAPGTQDQMAPTPMNRPAGSRRRLCCYPADTAAMFVLGSRGEREPATGRTLRPKQGRPSARWRGECLCLLYGLFVSVFAFFDSALRSHLGRRFPHCRYA